MTTDQMLAFENNNNKKILWDCYFPLQPAKRILNAPGERASISAGSLSESFELRHSSENNRKLCQRVVRLSLASSRNLYKIHKANLKEAEVFLLTAQLQLAHLVSLHCIASSRDPT